MSKHYIGEDLSAQNSTQTITYFVPNTAAAGEQYYTNISMKNLDGYYKCGSITMSASATVNLSYSIGDATAGYTTTGTITSSSVTDYVNYKVENNEILFTLNTQTPSGFTLTISWSGDSSHRAYYTKVDSTYDGTQKTGVTNYYGCTLSGQNTGTNAGTYTTILSASSNNRFALCYYFSSTNTATGGVASGTQNVNWTIAKADQTWTADDMDLSSATRARITINGNYYYTSNLTYSYNGSIIYVDNSYIPAYVTKVQPINTTLSITADGGQNYNSLTRTINVKCRAKQIINMGSLDSTLASDQLVQTISSVEAGDEIYFSISMINQNGYYKSGSVAMETIYTGTLDFVVGSTYGGADLSGTIDRYNDYEFCVNYLQQNNIVVITVPRAISSSFTVSAFWTASTNRLASYSATTSYTYEVDQHGTPVSHRCVDPNSLAGCTITSGSTNSATDAGTYTVGLGALYSSIYGDAFYFASGVTSGVATSTQTINWTIAKANAPYWTADNIDLSAYATDNEQITIHGTTYGSLSYSGYSSIISLDTNYVPALVYRELYQGGVTYITITASGGNNYLSSSYVISVNCGSASNHIRIYVNGAWRQATPYIYDGTSWREATAYVYDNGWKISNS